MFNSRSQTIQDQLKQQLVALRNAAAQKREELRQENDAHAQIRKEIEVSPLHCHHYRYRSR